MKTAFVYAATEVDNDMLLGNYEGTRIAQCNSVILLDIEGTDDLNQFHEQIVEHTELMQGPVLVGIWGTDMALVRRVVYDLLSLGASVVFELDDRQRHLIGKTK